ncbi:MAG TPA: hypothetical protein VFO01_03125 [Trebonia sp.]|nr:hypothetical protein [Trebonia sp.]
MTGEAARTPAEQEWLQVAAFRDRERYDLAVRAAGGYPPEFRVAGTPLLAPPAWRLPAPVPLGGVRLEFRPGAPPPDVPDLAALAPCTLPERADGTRYRRYTDVVAALAPPAVFENRPIYRLIEADLAGAGGEGPRLVFGRGRYFDGMDAGGAAGHEYAAARLGRARGCPYRAALGGPFGLAGRAAPLAASALTLRYDRSAGTATFPLHYREPGKVGHAGGLYQVIPVGVFQPSGEAPWNEARDFSLWRGLLREYAEEFLGLDEDHGSERAPIDYQDWPLAKALTGGLADGTVGAWCLGLGADPLTFALDLLTVVVIDAPLYDDLFGGMVDENAEGRVIRPRPFDAPAVTELLASVPLQAAAAALLALALAHRTTLLPLPAALAPLAQARPLGAGDGVPPCPGQAGWSADASSPGSGRSALVARMAGQCGDGEGRGRAGPARAAVPCARSRRRQPQWPGP